MAYGGESEVEAGGAKVKVQRGMGTSVATQGPPSPPEPLLPAPVLAGPEPDAERACADPPLAWQAVPQAASYIVEVCRDPGCGALVDRRVGETATEWRPAGAARRRALLAGDRPQPLGARRLSERGDPPGHHVGPGRPAGGPGRGGLAPGRRPAVARRRPAVCGPRPPPSRSTSDKPARWLPMIGGKQESAWPATWSPGEHTAGAVAVDGCGGRAAIAPVSFIVDAEPPAIRWEVGDRSSLSDRLAPDTEQDRRRLGGRRSGGRAARDAWKSRAGIWQLPLPWVTRQGEGAGGRAPADHPQRSPPGVLRRALHLPVDQRQGGGARPEPHPLDRRRGRRGGRRPPDLPYPRRRRPRHSGDRGPGSGGERQPAGDRAAEGGG